ncbi:2-dehydro-3-deoxyglucarate aldolase [Caballeronia hypogeia]|uniref:2-dehydro-3-deoxyglucarate aldolase n=1 Tax=Caballeronia hypogeia TaxID=1777140 RepID=A0A158CLA8_9BURK|nr:aldolase/citrate lyase family protein [Caballeronia hypogeia]SAK82307.1 2-dehydro-3-deoxyglucarate aldolase [Caballeronia hypogeia]
MSDAVYDKNHLGLWFSGPNISAAEIARSIGYRTAILDIEHGTFDLVALDRFVPFLKALGFEVFAKILGPTREAVQQALDFGCDAVAIPHISSAEEAARVCGYAKFPPLGDRSLAGGRTTNFVYPKDDWIDEQNRGTKCFPMIEDERALKEVSKILALDTVDGVFIAPTDLAIRRGRKIYKKTDADYADFKQIIEAAKAAGKPWLFPAWSPEEKAFAIEHGASRMFIAMEQFALAQGLTAAWTTTIDLVEKRQSNKS